MPQELFRKFDSPNLRGALGGALFLLLFSVAISVHYRPGTIGHHDSAYYLDGARHLARGEGFVSAESGVNGEKLAIANWPPGFSLLMVPGLWLGLSVHESAAFVLGGSYVLLLLSIYALLLLCTRFDRWPFALASCLVFGLTASLLDMLNRLLSDLPMSAALVLTLAVSVALLRALPDWRATKSAYGISALWAGLLAAVVLIRWAGMFAVFGVMTAVAVSVPLATLRRLWKRACVFVAVCGAVVGSWMLRNWALTGETMGERHLETTDPSLHLERAVSGVFLWATDARVLFGAESFWWNLYQTLLGVLFLLLVLGFRKATFDFPLGVRLVSITAAAYFFGLVFSASSHTFNSLLHPRYWIFVWAVLLCLAFSASAATTGKLKWATQGAFSLSLLVSFIVGLLHYYARHDAARLLAGTRVAPVQEVAEEMSKKNCQIVSNDNRVLLVNHGYNQLFRFPSSKGQLRKLSTLGAICVVWVRPEGASRLKAAKKQRQLLSFAEKMKWIHLERRRKTYEIWLPGPS